MRSNGETTERNKHVGSPSEPPPTKSVPFCFAYNTVETKGILRALQSHNVGFKLI